MAANQPKFTGNGKGKAPKQNPVQHDAVVLFDRDHTVVDDDRKAVDPRLAVLFSYCILKKIPVGFVSTGAHVDGYAGDDRLGAIHAMYPVENQPGYLTNRGMKFLDQSFSGFAGALQLGTVAIRSTQSDHNPLQLLQQDVKVILVQGMTTGQYNPETHELSCTDDKINASFKVKIDPNHTFNIQLLDKNDQPGLVLTINVHELLSGSYKEIGDAKGKIYGCMQVLTEMHILPILDREMKSAGIVAITGPEDYSRVSISRVVMMDDEDIIVQNLGRAGLHTILADTPSRYNSLYEDPKNRNAQLLANIQSYQDKIRNADIENAKSSLLQECAELLKTVVKIYKEGKDSNSEFIPQVIEQLKAKSAELRQLDARRLDCDAERLERHIEHLESLLQQADADHSEKVQLAEKDVMNFEKRTREFYVDVFDLKKKISEIGQKIEENTEELERLDASRPPVFNTFIDGLAKHLGFSSFTDEQLQTFVLKNRIYEILNIHASQYIQINEDNIHQNRNAKTAFAVSAASRALSFFGQEILNDDDLYRVAREISQKNSVEEILSYINSEKAKSETHPSADFRTALTEIKIAMLHVDIDLSNSLEYVAQILHYAIEKAQVPSEPQAKWLELKEHAQTRMKFLPACGAKSSKENADKAQDPSSSSNLSSMSNPSHVSGSSSSSRSDSPNTSPNSSSFFQTSPKTAEAKHKLILLKNFLERKFDMDAEKTLRDRFEAAEELEMIQEHLGAYYFDNNLASYKDNANGRVSPIFWQEVYGRIDSIYELPAGSTASAIKKGAEERQKTEQESLGLSIRNSRSGSN